MIQALHLSFRWDKFLVSLFLSIQSFSVSGKLSPHNVEMPSISPLQVCPSVVGVPTTPFDPSPKDAFSSSLWQKLAFLLHSFISMIYILFLSSGGIAMLFFSPIISFCQRSCSFHAYPFNRSVVPFCSSSFRLIKPCISFLLECCPNLFFPISLF